MQELTPEGRRRVAQVAQQHSVSTDAALTVLRALLAGHGTAAQFNHPDLGGMGQWTQGGMTMVGTLFDEGLKARVDALCTTLAALLRDQPEAVVASSSQSQHQASGPEASRFVAGSTGPWWPSELGQPSAAGSQNELGYAVFPAAQRLAIETNGRVTLYDTGDHQISGIAQQQSADQSLTFTSQHGLVRLEDLRVVGAGDRSSGPDPRMQSPVSPPPSEASGPVSSPSHPPQVSPETVLATLERLAELHQKGVLTDAEFAAKKAELLARI
jgi:Short C-terminal domain